MTESKAADPLSRLLGKLRERAWFWLFSQEQIGRGLRHASSVAVAEACWTGREELEVWVEPNLPGALENRQIAVQLRLVEGGGLTVTSACGNCGRPHCWHAAALLGRLSGEGGESLLRAALARAPVWEEEGGEPPGRFVPSAGAVRTAEIVDSPIWIDEPTARPVLLLRRLPGRYRQASAKGGKSAGNEVRLSVAVPMLAYEGCPDRFYLATTRLVSHHEFKDAEGRRVRLRRNPHRERSLLTELRMTGLESLGVVAPEFQPEGPATGCLTVPQAMQPLFWARFREETVPLLEGDGWRVEVAADFGHDILIPDEESWFSDLDDEEGSGGNWFRLNLGFAIGGRRISLVPVLSRALEEGLTPEVLEEAAGEDRGFLLALDEPDDPVVEIQAVRLLPLMRLLTELMSLKSGGRNSQANESGMRLDRLRAAQLTELSGLHVTTPDLARLRERVAGFHEMRLVEPPASLQATLRAYQREGLSWLQFLREFELHGVLADDMGLGKTLQTISHLLLEKQVGRADRPSLVVAPTSVIRNWTAELRKFAPNLKVLLLHGSDRRSLFRKIGRHDVVVTSYPLLMRDVEVLKGTPWHLVVLDEAQNIKNAKSQASQCARALQARHRLCLTGTPMENHLGELWSLFDFLMPGFLGDAESFRRAFRNPIEKNRDKERQALLARRLQPLMIRRTKDAVATELPPKTELLHHIELEGAQSDLYETIRAMMDQRVREAIASQGMERSHIVVLDALLKLRQVCCHPRLLKSESANAVEGSAKLRFLMEELLPELLEEGRRVLIFSQFTEMLALIEAELREAGIAFVKLTGATKDRVTPVRRFQEGEVSLFLISLKAGGSGLNLTAADTVIHYDPWWHPAAEAQASDRAHRIGQKNPVFVHKLICAGTIEDKIVELQRGKAALLEGLLGGRAERGHLTPEDVRRLLEPL